MKKQYHKPVLVYEDLSLAGATIAGCRVNPNALQIGECTVDFDPEFPTDFYIFNPTYGVCNIQAPGDLSCAYDVSGEMYSLFIS